ncbi:MAG: hypothetical protein JOY58_07085 [Solirubrobacterales bacterium]|nr:hypothetical protein [Solirubrobacterales bacterium]
MKAPPARGSLSSQPRRAPSAEPWTLRLFGREHPWSATTVVLVLVSALLVVAARTRPGFDPYGWLVWGHQTLAGNLDTNAAPSWKPLPYLFTVPYALAGHYQLWLWMITAVAVSLSGAVFAARIAYRLTAPPPERRFAGLVAGAFAGLALLGISDYWHYIFSYQSDPMIVALCLGAIDCHLSGRPRWAFVLAALASLGRPEVWLFAGLYALWSWRAMPSMRPLIAGGVLVVVALWFGVPALTSRTPFVAASNALGSGRRLHSNQVVGTAKRFLDLYAAPLEIVALCSVALALLRRDRATLALAGGVVAWVVLEIAFALHGWPGLGRYMFEAAGVMVVIAAVFIGRLLSGPLQPPNERFANIPGWLAAALVVVICASLVPSAISRARSEHKDLRVQRARTTQINLLHSTISQFGGAPRFASCGEPLTRLEYQSILAWTLRLNVSSVGFKYGPAIASRRPIVLFTPWPQRGWKVQALRQHRPRCRTLPA